MPSRLATFGLYAGQPHANRCSPGTRSCESGAQLHALRADNGLTAARLAARLRLLFSPSKVGRIETGPTGVVFRGIRDLCDLYEAAEGAELDHVVQLARDGKHQAWWQHLDLRYSNYTWRTAGGIAISNFRSPAFPGLFHTIDDARVGHKAKNVLLPFTELIIEEILEVFPTLAERSCAISLSGRRCVWSGLIPVMASAHLSLEPSTSDRFRVHGEYDVLSPGITVCHSWQAPILIMATTEPSAFIIWSREMLETSRKSAWSWTRGVVTTILAGGALVAWAEAASSSKLPIWPACALTALTAGALYLCLAYRYGRWPAKPRYKTTELAGIALSSEQNDERPCPELSLPSSAAECSGQETGILDSKKRVATLPPSGDGHDTHRLRILALIDEWFPARGGISELNRALCRALASLGHHVFCLVPAATSDEVTDARAAQVHLIIPSPLPGGAEREVLLRRPSLPDHLPPDVIIGHGSVTGPAAMVQAEDNYPKAARLHFVHMWPGETEVQKPDRKEDVGVRAEDRSWTELDLGRDATRIVAIGPRLYELVARELSEMPKTPDPVRLDPGFDSLFQEPREPVPGTPRILMLGRLKDAHLKGLDIAANAVGYAVRLRGGDEPELELRVRGAVPGQAEQLRKMILRWAAVPSLHVEVQNYSINRDRLRHELRLSSLVLMPSRAEGFGLVGLEAIVEGVPVLVSGRSGLGRLLRECLPAEDAARTVIQVVDDPDQDTPRWGSAVAAVLRDRKAAFANADTVRRIMAEKRSWRAAAEQLIHDAGLGFPAC